VREVLLGLVGTFEDVSEEGAGEDGLVHMDADVGQFAGRGGRDVEGDLADDKFDESIAGHDGFASPHEPTANLDRFVGRNTEIRNGDRRHHAISLLRLVIAQPRGCFDSAPPLRREVRQGPARYLPNELRRSNRARRRIVPIAEQVPSEMKR
jgi:hypothetical protein